MKKIQILLFALLFIAACTSSCEDTKKCDCDAYTIGSSQDYRKTNKVTYCHNGRTISVDDTEDHGTTHDDGTECYPGSCETLGTDDVTAISYSNNCQDDNKTVWIEDKPYAVICKDRE